ncbi:MAG: sigma-54-dependent transcriptional regulator [Sandaracinaceae bacterium]
MGTRKGHILVVDDDLAVGVVLAGMLTQAGHHAEHVPRADEALERVRSGRVDVVVTDLRMPEMDGMALLDALAQLAPGLPSIMLTAHGTMATAVEAMKRGAHDFLTKPFDREEVLHKVDTALRLSLHATDAPTPARSVEEPRPGLGASAAMQEVSARIERAARANSTVLIRGESGSGKEVAARAIHTASPRADGPFIPVHCAALPDNLLESELFGYEKGAFTGAAHQKPGRVELAAGGTLFLDEIGDISLATQVKLLRLLNDKEYQRLGGTRSLSADIRFVAATHRDLEAMLVDGSFREDLFYRLNVIPIEMPPLRARSSDIPDLANLFCRELSAENGRPGLALEPAALARLCQMNWPGNVRQLANFVERLVVFADGSSIGEADVLREMDPSFDARPDPPETLDGTRRDAEHQAIVDALEKASGNRTKAARILGISRRTLYNKLAEMDEVPSR